MNFVFSPQLLHRRYY